jgi:hypothetical protein
LSALSRPVAGRRAAAARACIAAAAGLLAAVMLLGVPWAQRGAASAGRQKPGQLSNDTASRRASAILLISGPRRDAGPRASTKPAPSWLVKSNDLILLRHRAKKDGVKLPAFTWVGCGGKSDPDSCVTGQQPIFTSFLALQSEAQTGWQGTAIFDIETWKYTPRPERKHPDRFICRAAHLMQVDSHLKVIITPYAKPPAKRLIGEDVAAAKCGAYAVDVQTQFINGSPARFGRFISKAVRAIRRVSSKIIVLAGLATNNPSVQTAAHLAADYRRALAAGVNGFWLNAAKWGPRNQCKAAQGGPGCPQVGVKFLEDIGLAHRRHRDK